jgi:hypothetical protein
MQHSNKGLPYPTLYTSKISKQTITEAAEFEAEDQKLKQEEK